MIDHFCTEHNVKFFKTANMRAYAHPVEGEFNEKGKQVWCAESPEKATIAPEAPVVTATPLKPVIPSQTTNDSIKQQVAIKEIGENLRANIPQPHTYVIRYWHLLGESLGIPVQTPTLGDPIPSVKIPPAGEDLFRTEEIKREPYFKDGAELAKWYVKQGGTLARFKVLTSNPNPNDIKDVIVAAKMVIKEDGSIIK